MTADEQTAVFRSILDQTNSHWRDWCTKQIKDGNKDFLKELMHNLMGDDSAGFLLSLGDCDALAMVAQLAGTQLGYTFLSLVDDDI